MYSHPPVTSTYLSGCFSLSFQLPSLNEWQPLRAFLRISSQLNFPSLFVSASLKVASSSLSDTFTPFLIKLAFSSALVMNPSRLESTSSNSEFSWKTVSKGIMVPVTAFKVSANTSLIEPVASILQHFPMLW